MWVAFENWVGKKRQISSVLVYIHAQFEAQKKLLSWRYKNEGHLYVNWKRGYRCNYLERFWEWIENRFLNYKDKIITNDNTLYSLLQIVYLFLGTCFRLFGHFFLLKTFLINFYVYLHVLTIIFRSDVVSNLLFTFNYTLKCISSVPRY